MLELNIKCEDAEQARVYLNAPQYLSLLQDLQQAIRNAKKHGNDISVLRVVDTFYSDINAACEHSEGAY